MARPLTSSQVSHCPGQKESKPAGASGKGGSTAGTGARPKALAGAGWGNKKEINDAPEPYGLTSGGDREGAEGPHEKDHEIGLYGPIEAAHSRGSGRQDRSRPPAVVALFARLTMARMDRILSSSISPPIIQAEGVEQEKD